MAKDTSAAEKASAGQVAPSGGKSPILSRKMLMIGLPVFLVQLVVVVLVLKMFVFTSSGSAPTGAQAASKGDEHSKAGERGEGSGAGAIFVVKDVIVNPAGTNGTRFLLTTVGFEVNSPEVQKELEAKEVQVRDILNTILTSKGLDELVDPGQREALRTEISERVNGALRSGSLSSVYFSKFIIQ